MSSKYICKELIINTFGDCFGRLGHWSKDMTP